MPAGGGSISGKTSALQPFQGPGKVEERNTVLVSADMVAVDAYAARLLGYQPEDIPHIGLAAEAGVGKSDLSAIKVAVA